MGKLLDLVGRNNAVDIRLSANGRYRVEHVVRGNTHAEVLEAMEHEPDQLIERLRVAREAAISGGVLPIRDAQRLMPHLEGRLRQTTYLQT